MYTYNVLINMHRDDLVDKFLKLQADFSKLHNEFMIAIADEKRAVAAADRLQDNVIQLNKELSNLKETVSFKSYMKAKGEVDELRVENERLHNQTPKKVVLPKEVAEAIDYYDSYGSLSNLGVINCIINEKSKIATDARIALEQRVGEDTADILMKALINGYTVEEPPSTEDRLRTELTPKIEEWLRVPSGWGVEEARNELLKLIIPVVRQVLAEDRQEETID